MFIKAELWEDQAQGPVNARLFFDLPMVVYLPVNTAKFWRRCLKLDAIVSFSKVDIRTIGRPGTTDNKTDCLPGIRILLADGSTFLVIDDRNGFVTALSEAEATGKFIYDLGQSTYMEKFANLPCAQE